MHFFENDIMTVSAVLRRAPAMTPRALTCAISLCFSAATPAPVFAADPAPTSVTISGARFAADPGMLPIGASVINFDDIRRAGATDVNEAIRKIGGVYGRQSLDGSPDFGLDLRGFGTNSSQNLVVVLDGVRLSENELSGAVLSAIPIDSVERIEILRGGASVLYGDGATGGVIRIVTKRPSQGSVSGNVRAEVGQFGARAVSGSAAQRLDGVALDATVGEQRTDNYRANNGFKQVNLGAGAQWFTRGGRFGVRLDSARQQSRFAGSLSEAQFLANPRQTTTPNDFGSLDYDRVTAFAEQRVGELELAAELAQRRKTVKATYVGSYGTSAYDYEGRQTQFSPRARYLSRMDGMLNELVGGIDLIRWERSTTSDYSQAQVSQHSRAIYLRDEIKWDLVHDGRLALGARHEVFDKDASDPLSGPSASVSTSQAQNAWEVQGSYRVVPLVNLYAKAGQSYRVANADENALTVLFNVPLKGQSSHDLELGASVGDASRMLTARLFRHQLSNEIFYDPTAGKYGDNVNLDPTRRQGLELDGTLDLAHALRLSAHLQHVAASFTAGPNAGKQMVLVPANILSARLSWVPTDGQSADVGVQWVGSQRDGGDFDNSCAAKMASYATVDARYARKFGAWEVAVAGLNLTDKQYTSQAFGCQSGIYPNDGRQLKVSARYDF